MNMNLTINNNLFDNLFNLVSTLSESKEEECLICHLPILKNDKNMKVMLPCKHSYHMNCISKCFNSKFIECPYCCKVTTRNKIIYGSPCKFIMKSGKRKGEECKRYNCKYHTKEKTSETKKIILDDSVYCKAILKTGKNKGKPCNRKNCKIHKSNQVENSDIEV